LPQQFALQDGDRFLVFVIHRQPFGVRLGAFLLLPVHVERDFSLFGVPEGPKKSFGDLQKRQQREEENMRDINNAWGQRG
jgi:hypothetical protein